jgi:hypothetical protein
MHTACVQAANVQLDTSPSKSDDQERDSSSLFWQLSMSDDVESPTTHDNDSDASR